MLQPVTINSDHGLPNEQVHKIVQDHFGRLWMAGPAGLSQYDGNKITAYDTRDGLETFGLRTLAMSGDSIWIGTDRGIESFFISGKKRELELEFDWIYGIADSIIIDATVLWVGTSCGLLQISAVKGKLNLLKQYDFGLVQDIILQGDGSLLLASGKYGLILFNHQNWHVVNKELPPGDSIVCLKKTVDDRLLVGTLQGLYLLSDQYVIEEHFFSDTEHKKVSAIATIGDNWWFGVGPEILLLSPQISGLKVKERFNIGGITNDLFVDDFKNIWVGTNNHGLKKISCLNSVLKKINCDHHGAVYSIKEDIGDRGLIVSGNGFSSAVSLDFSDHNPRIISEFPSVVWDSCFDPKDSTKLWFATQEGIFTSVNGEKAHPEIDFNAYINSPARVLLVQNDEIWVGTISGLYIINGSEIREILNDDGNKFGYIYSLSTNESKEVWIATLGQGLWLANKDKIYSIKNDLISDLGNTYCVDTNTFGQTIVLQEEKVILLDTENNAKLILSEYPLAGWSACWIDEEKVAVGSNSGVIIIDVVSCQVITRINAYLEKADWQFTFSQSIFLYGNDQLFCGLNGGLWLIDLKEIGTFTKPPDSYLSEVSWQNVEPHFKNQTYYLNPGKWSVNVGIFSPWFIDEKLLTYRYRLVGFDEHWSNLNSTPIIRFSSIPRGSYSLQVQAYTTLTGLGQIKTVLQIEVAPAKWVNPLTFIVDSFSTFYTTIYGSIKRNQILLGKNIELENEIDERKKVENELQKHKETLEEIVTKRTKDLKIQIKRAESADKMKSAFLAHMSHEIRTPLAHIIGLNSLIEMTDLDSEQSDYSSKIDSSANHLLQIINDILDLSKIESGKIDIEEVPMSINQILKEVAIFAQFECGAKNLGFDINKNIKNDFVKGDPLRIKQVLLNLIGNAIKFTSKGSITLEARPTLSTIRQQGVEFRIIDTGIGMTPGQMSNIFGLFEQADSSTSRKYGGTGLGLSISKNFVTLLGGDLVVESTLNQGSIFSFSLIFDRVKEIKVDEEDPAALDDNEPYPKGFERVQGKRVLIVEDDKINQIVIEGILRSAGFETKSAFSGFECIEIINNSEAFDLVVMDIQMPEMDGFETTRRIRNETKTPNIKILAITAEALAGTKDKVLSCGMDAYLTKPIARNELFKKLIELLPSKIKNKKEPRRLF